MDRLEAPPVHSESSDSEDDVIVMRTRVRRPAGQSEEAEEVGKKERQRAPQAVSPDTISGDDTELVVRGKDGG